MRLLDARTLRLTSFEDSSVPPYAILSHTWDATDVTYDDIIKSSEKDILDRKIRFTAQQTLKDELTYFWVDTLCINRKNMNELNTAVNSMFTWYQHASVCYVYLSDVSCNNTRRSRFGAEQSMLLEESRWFTRGWTLHELIAPSQVMFYDCEWHELGSRLHLAEHIARITRVPRAILQRSGRFKPHEYSTAQRMSWASSRSTTRVEDEAYCLLGIFDVNMPLIYGEGTKAFLRLQKEILRRTNDFSIFAWVNDESDGNEDGSLLAKRPAAFSQSEHIVLVPELVSSCWLQVESTMVLSLLMIHEAPSGHDLHATAMLPCRSKYDTKSHLAIALQRNAVDQCWRRAWSTESVLFDVSSVIASRAFLESILVMAADRLPMDDLYDGGFEFHGKVTASQLDDNVMDTLFGAANPWKTWNTQCAGSEVSETSYDPLVFDITIGSSRTVHWYEDERLKLHDEQAEEWAYIQSCARDKANAQHLPDVVQKHREDNIYDRHRPGRHVPDLTNATVSAECSRARTSPRLHKIEDHPQPYTRSIQESSELGSELGSYPDDASDTCSSSPSEIGSEISSSMDDEEDKVYKLALVDTLVDIIMEKVQDSSARIVEGVTSPPELVSILHDLGISRESRVQVMKQTHPKIVNHKELPAVNLKRKAVPTGTVMKEADTQVAQDDKAKRPCFRH